MYLQFIVFLNYSIIFILACLCISTNYPTINKKRIIPVCLSILLSYNSPNLKKHLLLFKIGNIVFIIDDYLDDVIDGTSERIEDLKVLLDIEENFESQNIKDLKKILSEIERLTPIDKVRKEIGILIKGFENEYKGNYAENIDEYISITSQTSGVRFYNELYKLIMGIENNSENLKSIIKVSSNLIRLENDLISYAEDFRNNNPNVLIILSRTQNITINQAEKIVMNLSERYYKQIMMINNNNNEVYISNVLAYVSFTFRLYRKKHDFDKNNIVSLLKIWIDELQILFQHRLSR